MAAAMLAMVGLAGTAALGGLGLCRGAAVGRLVAALVWRARARTPADTTARLTELQARIRPHFLFNTLNSAIALVRDDPARAEALLEDLSDLFRHALVDQGEAVTLAEEIALARATWPSSRCALASGCSSNGRSTRRPGGPPAAAAAAAAGRKRRQARCGAQ
jgi:hypothetical protein